MSYSRGIDLGTTYTAAAIYENDRASIIDLGSRTATMPSVVFLDEGGSFLVGDAAVRYLKKQAPKDIVSGTPSRRLLRRSLCEGPCAKV